MMSTDHRQSQINLSSGFLTRSDTTLLYNHRRWLAVEILYSGSRGIVLSM